MKSPTWNIAEAIKREADLLGSYVKLAKKINIPDSPNTVGRRKLKDIADGKEFTISTRELVALDDYFSRTAEGFADQPLFARQNLLKEVAVNDKLHVLVGAFQRNEEERNDVSLWDVKAYGELLTGARRFREGIQSTLQDIPFFDANGKHSHPGKAINAFLSESKRSVCVIGSTRANVAAEIVLAGMFGIEPFAPSTKKKVPFKFVWPEDAARRKAGFVSAFQATGQEVAKIDTALPEQARAGAGVYALLVANDVLRVVPQPKETWSDYGIVAAQRLADDKVRIVLAGLTGPATYASAKACRTAIHMELPSPARKGKPRVLWAVVKATISPGHPGIGDTRDVQAVELVGTPKIWPAG